MEKSKSHFSPNKNVLNSAKTSKDVKGKGKIDSETKNPSKRSETNSKEVEKKFVKQQIRDNQNKISSKDKNQKDNRIHYLSSHKER